MSAADWILVLVCLCICEAIAIVTLLTCWLEERDEGRFWYESSVRAWDFLFARAGIPDDPEATT